MRSLLQQIINAVFELKNIFNVTKQDLARDEVAEAARQVKRLEDLAAHHRELAGIYQQGAVAIRGGTSLQKVMNDNTRTAPTNEEKAA